MKTKPKVAFFDFSCCEGCQLTVLRIGETLFDLLDHVEVVAWREVMSGDADDYDIAFCEGSIRWQHDIERLEDIRERADILVSLGSCASIGCHNELANPHELSTLRQTVYFDTGFPEDIIEVRPVSEVVDVDYTTLGCPVSTDEFIKVFKAALTGKSYSPPNAPVCVECKLNDHLCVYEKKRTCLGPLTRCGCGAACTAYGDGCRGCRGLVDDANLKGAVGALTSVAARHPIMQRVVTGHALQEKDVLRMYGLYTTRKKLQTTDYQDDD